jgi:hypothetical protein
MEREGILQQAFRRGVLCGMLVIVAANGVHWLITPMAHPDAGSVATALVVAQVVVCAVGAAWLYARRRTFEPA